MVKKTFFDLDTNWVNNIKKILLDSNLYTNISKNAYEDYQQKYTWDIRAQKIINIYKMPNFFCEYCGIYLKHSSPFGRK